MCWAPRRVGSQHSLLCGRRSWEFPFKWQVGPDWPVVVLVYAIILGIEVPVLYMQFTYINVPVFVVGLLLVSSLLGAYSATACTDPGIVSDPMPLEVEVAVPEEQNRQGAPQARYQQVSGSGDDVDIEQGLVVGVDEVVAPGDVGDVLAESAVKGSDTNGNGNGDPGSRREEDTKEDPGSRREEDTKEDEDEGEGPGDASGSAVAVPPPFTPPTSISPPHVPDTIPCSKCNILRPYTATHCYYCNVCIDDIDHHCPWSGQCIAQKNLVAFRVFVGLIGVNFWYATGTFIYAITVVVRRMTNN